MKEDVRVIYDALMGGDSISLLHFDDNTSSNVLGFCTNDFHLISRPNLPCSFRSKGLKPKRGLKYRVQIGDPSTFIATYVGELRLPSGKFHMDIEDIYGESYYGMSSNYSVFKQGRDYLVYPSARTQILKKIKTKRSFWGRLFS